MAVCGGGAFLTAPDGYAGGVGTEPAFTCRGSGLILGGDSFVGIPIILIVLIFVAIVGHVLLRYTDFGRSIYALGGNATAARLAGIMAAKRTADTIPLCHPIGLTHIDVELRPIRNGYAIESRVRTSGQTGVEMEALHAVAVAALTVYDMIKAVDPRMVIEAIRLVEKRGGRSDYRL